jgi:type VI secretion system protein VasJ
MDKDGRVPAGVLPQLVRNVIENARQLAGHFLSMNATDERGYQLNRAALWSTLQQLPQTDAAGKTQLTSGVPADKMQAYVAAVDGKQYAEILPPLERSAGKAPFWLDGHFMVVRCLEGLEAHVAASVVREALSALLKRFPELLSYKFKDNTPFASARVLPWLETLRAPTPVGSFAPGVNPGAFGPEGSEEETRLQEALACNTEKDFQSGLRRLGTVPAGRSRSAVLHGVIQARYCLMAGRKKAAAQLLSAVYLQMEQWNMLDWEPELTARILALLLSSQPQQRGGATEDMLRRLHWFNLDTALSVSQEA